MSDMKLSREGRVRGLWSLVSSGGFGIEIVALHRCVFECGGGGEYGGAGLLVGFGDLPAGLGVWRPVIMLLLRWVLLEEGCGCKSVVSMGFTIRFLWWTLARRGRIPGSLCLSSAGGLLEHPICGPLHCRA